MKQVAVLGYGTVGSGVVEVIDRNSAVIEKRVGEKLNVKYILDLRDFPGDPNEKKVVHDINVILDDLELLANLLTETFHIRTVFIYHSHTSRTMSCDILLVPEGPRMSV